VKSINLQITCFFIALCACTSGWAEEVNLNSGGLSLRADWEPVSADPATAVLLLHGTMAHKDMEIIQTLQTGLGDNDITTLAISLSLGLDNRSGMLPCDIEQVHKHSDALKELTLWVNWLQQKGVKNVWLLGHSRGANQVSSFVRIHPGKISGLLLIAPPAVSHAQIAASYQQHNGQSLDDLIPLAQMQMANGSGQNLENIGFLHCQNAMVSPSGFLSYYRDANLDTPALLRGLELPVLLVSGSEDKVSPNIATAAAGLNQPNIEWLDVDGADHFFRDLYADDIVDAILERMESSE